MLILVQNSNGQDQKRNSQTSFKTLKAQSEEKVVQAAERQVKSHMTTGPPDYWLPMTTG